ncbi:MAG: hypothetical protein EP329_23180, partial [Deltaproteobacteria bacterium]
MSAPTDTLSALRADAGSTTVILIERAHEGGTELLSAVVARQGRGLMATYRADDLDDAARAELIAAATPDGATLTPCDPTAARLLLARGLAMARIAQRPVPAWIVEPNALTGDLD